MNLECWSVWEPQAEILKSHYQLQGRQHWIETKTVPRSRANRPPALKGYAAVLEPVRQTPF